MNNKRQFLTKQFWDRSKLLNLNNKKYYSYIKKLFNEKLREDIGKGDITTNSFINKNKKIKAIIIAKQDGIIAGIGEIFTILNDKTYNNKSKIKKYNSNKIKLNITKNDGSKVKNNDRILEIQGNAGIILSCERTILNILQRMSGIATLTYNISNKLKNNCLIAATRKTLWDLLDKKAVSIGHGLTHRLNLSDSILIKDNHLKLLKNNIEKALRLSVKNKKSKYIEIEVKNENDAMKAAYTIHKLKKIYNKNNFAIMFDNMDAISIKKTINKINNINNKKLKNKILFEASGNIYENNIIEYSKTGVDIISLGILTHSPKAFDMSLEIN